MSAAYDYYDYPSYWLNRRYEHSSEIIAINSLLSKIPHIKKAIDIGSGYGRLTPAYLYRSKKIYLSDPSSKLLSIARNNLKKYSKKINYIHSKIENLNKKAKPSSFDLAIMIRVAHHLTDLDSALTIINRLLKTKGYFILEYANKKHFKASFSELIKGNYTFLMDIFPKDIRSKKNIKKKTLPFINYHPDIVKNKLISAGFEIIETLSVSNIRSNFLKNILPLETLLSLEKRLQKPLASISFGPSIFILARKSPTS